MKRERNVLALLTGITGVSVIGWLTQTFPPDTNLIVVFFLLVFISGFSLMLFLTQSKRQALLFASGISTLLLLRLIGLRGALYTLLLIASLISLEVYLKKR